jgi:spermidine synthase
VYLAGVVRAFGAGVRAALTVECLAELALQLLEVGAGLGTWRRLVRLTCGVGGLGGVRCRFSSGLLDSHADLPGGVGDTYDTYVMGRRATQVPVNSVDGAHGRAELLRDADRRAAWILLVDGVPQSHVDLDDPGYLDFEYVRRLGHVIDTSAPQGQPLRVLHLGAGALTLARYVAATRPGSSQLAVEVDAALVDLVRLRLPLRRVRVRVRVGDARAVLERLRAGSYDAVIADVFAGGRTPAHLTSVEFAAAARRVLTAEGVFAANVADGAPLAHARAQVATVRAVFPQVALVADAGVLRGRRFGNLVLVASPEPLPVGRLTRLAAGDPMPGRVLYGEELTRFAAGAKPVSDANARPSPAPPADAFAG